MLKLDVTKTNLAIEKLLEVTENPRHRFLLQPEMMSAVGGPPCPFMRRTR
jgi:hypothetical protein